MPKFKISVSKNQKKYSIILNADSDVLARKKVHSEWYSILSVEEINEDKIEGHKFIFEAVDKDWNIKKWKVVANDPFKVYVKLKEGLWYKVKFLYSQTEENKSEWIKLDIVKHLEEQYNLYNSRKSKNISEENQKKDNKLEKKNLDNFYMKKELDDTYRLIDFVLIKLKHILDNVKENEISLEKKVKIQNIYNSIRKLKKTTNIAKLKDIWEKALKKIWEIELSIVEKNKDKNSRKYLKETNKLLKEIGSKESFIEKDKDINYIINNFIKLAKEKLNSLKKIKKEKKEIDKESTSYWKTKLLIQKYSEKQKEINKEIFKTYFRIFKPWEKEKLEDLEIKKQVVKQNLIILKAKQTGKIVSYTKIIKWYNYFIELLLLLFKILNTYIISFIYLFSLLISTLLLLDKLNILDINFNINWIFILLYILFGSFLIFLSRGIITATINIAIFIFMIILWVVNF